MPLAIAMVEKSTQTGGKKTIEYVDHGMHVYDHKNSPSRDQWILDLAQVTKSKIVVQFQLAIR